LQRGCLLKQKYQFPIPQAPKRIEDYLIDDTELSAYEKETTYTTFVKYLNNKYNIGKHTIESLLKDEFDVIDTRQSDLRIYKNKIPTLRTGRHGIIYVRGGKFRKLTGYESLLLQGFPKEIALKAKGKISESYILAQTGNAMTVSTIEAVAKELIKII
jgi:DNA (cytosine-5)-methyltransferase 1